MLYLIAKPLKGKKAKLIPEIERRLQERNVAYELHFTASKEDGAVLAANFSAEKGNTVVVIGGDGTVNNVLSGLNVENAAFGIIPAGTGNDFADTAKIPLGLPALDLILNSEPKDTDFLQFSDGRRSLNVAGIGIDVDVLARCERMKHFRAKSKYFISLLKSLLTYRGCNMKIACGEFSAEGNFLLAAFCNGKVFGGGIPICPDAEIDDGKMNLIYAECPPRRKIPAALIKLMHGKILSLPFAHQITCTKAELMPEAPFFAQCDGELFEATSFSAEIVSGLKLFRG